jgi:mono/diheme cytochrome c family protein
MCMRSARPAATSTMSWLSLPGLNRQSIVLVTKRLTTKMDARVKPGHDVQGAYASLLAAVIVLVALGAGTAVAQTPGLGTPITEADIAAWNIDVLPDGTGLPPGSGTPAQGASVYAQKCAMCHGDNGINPRPGFLPMVGPSRFDRIDTMKTVPYYKYATTLFDVVRRSMPYQMPRTLSNDEVYALSAYILSLNKIIGENEVMNAETLPKVQMPNRDNFIVRYPDRI